MSCVPKFEKNLDFDCIKDIIVDARTGEFNADTVKRGLWVLGCGVEFFSPKQLIGLSMGEPKSIEELCDDLEMCSTPVFGSDENAEPVQNPLVWISLASLVFQMIKFLREKK